LKWSILILIFILALRVWDPWPVETIRLKYLDVLLTLKEEKESELIALYNIDEQALAENGQWPWPRSYLASLNTELSQRGAIAVVYSVLFPEPDRFLEDDEFALSMQEIPTFLSAVATTDTDRRDGWDIGVATMGPVLENAMSYPGILPNVPALQDASTGTGVVNSAPEVDGLVRRIPALINVQGQLYPALSVDVLRGLAGDPSYQARAGDAGIEAVRIPTYDTIQTDSAGRIWIDWNTTFKQDVENKIVYVGTTAAGISPLVPTPIGQLFPHQIQASLLETLLQGSAPVRPDLSLAVEIFFLMLLGLVAAGSARFLPVYGVPVSVLGISVLTASGSVWAYLRFGVLLDAALPVLSALTVGGTGIAQRMMAEYRLKMQIKGQFGTYVSPDLVKQLQDDPSKLVLGGETKELTFLFCDLVGFTPLSESLQDDPQKLVSIMNRALSCLTDVALSNGATVDKYIGDCIFLLWNAPLDCPDHEEKAVRTAGEMLVALNELNQELESDGISRLNIGIGINTGLCVVGNMGSESRFDYSVVGHACNSAARLEGKTRDMIKRGEIPVLIGETTAKRVPEMVRYVENITVKGQSESLPVYTLAGLNASMS
tara:strand:+ start:1111 stop:2916 length:1806 start_codon:yes stop_codon:yes gene_type:complete